jgi:hypothetical protein
MKQALFFTYISCLLLSAATAIIYRRYLIGRRLTIMAFYLPLLFIMEVYLAWHLHEWPDKSNDFAYNIYKPINVIVFAALYYSIPAMSRFRKLIVGITAVYLFIIIAAYAFIVPINVANTSITLARGICITFFAVFYLMSLLLLDNLAETKFWKPLTWITIGVLTFYPVVSISIGFYHYLRDYNATLFGLKLYQIVPQLMSIFMYSCFTYAFYLCKKKS